MIDLSEPLYRQVQAKLPTPVVYIISHVCTFCLYGLKVCNFSFYSMFFTDVFLVNIFECVLRVCVSNCVYVCFLIS